MFSPIFELQDVDRHHQKTITAEQTSCLQPKRFPALVSRSEHMKKMKMPSRVQVPGGKKHVSTFQAIYTNTS